MSKNTIWLQKQKRIFVIIEFPLIEIRSIKLTLIWDGLESTNLSYSTPLGCPVRNIFTTIKFIATCLLAIIITLHSSSIIECLIDEPR
jgi:hypothetical protein